MTGVAMVNLRGQAGLQVCMPFVFSVAHASLFFACLLIFYALFLESCILLKF